MEGQLISTPVGYISQPLWRIELISYCGDCSEFLGRNFVNQELREGGACQISHG